MKSFLIVLAKVLWVLVSVWTAGVFCVGSFDEWPTMDFMPSLIFCFTIVFPTCAVIAWLLPRDWRRSEAGMLLIMCFGMLSSFAVLGGWAFAFTTTPYETPVRYVASIVLTVHAALHVALAVYAVKAFEKRQQREWDRKHGFVYTR